MIRIVIKDFSVKKQAYLVSVVHHSGMIVELEIPMAESLNNIVKNFNQAIAVAEVNMAMAFYTDGQHTVVGAVKDNENTNGNETDQEEDKGNQEVPEIEAGNSGVRAVD